MTGRGDYSEDEWNTLHRGLTGAGMWVAVSEKGFTSTFKETGAIASFLAHQASEADNPLIRELAATKGTGWKVSSTPEELRQGTMAALKESLDLLQAKDAESVGAYRDVVLALAHRAAEAAPGGEDVEGNVINEIAAVLGDQSS